MRKQLFAAAMALVLAVSPVVPVVSAPVQVQAEEQVKPTTVDKGGFRFTIPDGYAYNEKVGAYTKISDTSLSMLMILDQSSEGRILDDALVEEEFSGAEQEILSEEYDVISTNPGFEKKTIAGTTAYIKDYKWSTGDETAALRIYLMQNDRSRITAAMVVAYPSESDYSDVISAVENATAVTSKVTYISESKFIKYAKKNQHKTLDDGKEKYVKIKIKSVRANKGAYKTDDDSRYVISTKGKQYYITNLGEARKLKKGQTLKLKVYSIGSTNSASTIANAYIGF